MRVAPEIGRMDLSDGLGKSKVLGRRPNQSLTLMITLPPPNKKCYPK